ncbi:hypothetical protein MHYP_G00177500 [Metynnis hypsauchen]
MWEAGQAALSWPIYTGLTIFHGGAKVRCFKSSYDPPEPHQDPQVGRNNKVKKSCARLCTHLLAVCDGIVAEASGAAVRSTAVAFGIQCLSVRCTGSLMHLHKEDRLQHEELQEEATSGKL